MGSVVAEGAEHSPHVEVDVSPVVACRDLPGDAVAEYAVAVDRVAAVADYRVLPDRGCSGPGVELSVVAYQPVE